MAKDVLNTAFGVGMIVEKDGKILFVEEAVANAAYGKKAGSVSFPSGHCLELESPLTAAVREVKEETGYSISLDSLIGLYIIRGGIGLAFTASLETDQPARTNDADISRVFWIKPEEALALTNLRPAVKPILNDYLNGDRFPVSLIHSLLS